MEQTKQPQTDEQREKRIKQGYEKFIKAVNPEKETMIIVLRCHLLAEYYLNQIIIANLPKGYILANKRDRLTFLTKLLIVESLEIVDSKVIQLCRNLNSLRNNFGHEQEYEITMTDLDILGAPLGKKYLKYKDCKTNIKEILVKILGEIIAHLNARADKSLEDNLKG